MIDTEVNQFPSLTWHHLHINHSYLRAPVSKEASYSVSELSDGLSLTKQSLNEHTSKLYSVKTGMGQNFDTAFNQSLKECNIRQKLNYLRLRYKPIGVVGNVCSALKNS